jgi:hypothetical protein
MPSGKLESFNPVYHIGLNENDGIYINAGKNKPNSPIYNGDLVHGIHAPFTQFSVALWLH